MEKETENLNSISLKLLVVSILFLAALFVFGFLADEVMLEKEDLFDTNVLLPARYITTLKLFQTPI
jgi:hypothetical protein